MPNRYNNWKRGRQERVGTWRNLSRGHGVPQWLPSGAAVLGAGSLSAATLDMRRQGHRTDYTVQLSPFILLFSSYSVLLPPLFLTVTVSDGRQSMSTRAENFPSEIYINM
jgi:hypothetical protein